VPAISPTVRKRRFPVPRCSVGSTRSWCHRRKPSTGAIDIRRGESREPSRRPISIRRSIFDLVISTELNPLELVRKP
jgi:hypothetical protein